MKELYLIMRELLELEYQIRSLGYILELAEKGLDDEKKGEAMLADSTRYYLNALQTELGNVINRLDTYMVRERPVTQ